MPLPAAVDAPPFEITEQGWGEFDIIISIHFKDPGEKPIDVSHTLRLFPPEGVPWPDGKPVISENIDQIVFNDPNEWFYNDLMAAKQEDGPALLQPYYISAAQAEEDAHLERILIAQKKIRDEIWRLKEKYEQTATKASLVRRLIDYQEAAIPALVLPTESTT
jgi:YEATS domain-containing protein 4